MSFPFEKMIKQLDLALDHLAQRDEDFDRFALMLVDNVVELTLRAHAREKALVGLSRDEKAGKTHLAGATGRIFGKKVEFAKSIRLVSSETAESIGFLHHLRNIAYHQGIPYTGAIHALTIFYLKIACELLQKYCHSFLSSFLSSNKYLGAAFSRRIQTADALHSDLPRNLIQDMSKIIKSTDKMIDELATRPISQKSREDMVKHALSWLFAFSAEGKKFADKCAVGNVVDIPPDQLIEFFMSKCEWPVAVDPISEWKKRLSSLKKVTNECKAVKMYCAFILETESIREQISDMHEQRFG